MTRIRGLTGFVALVLAGLAVSAVLGLGDLVTWPVYLVVATALLAVGLLGSTSQVSVDELRQNRARVLVAVSAGVVAKAAIIGGIMYWAFRDPAYVVLGVAVSQIDPLSTAASPHADRLTPRTRSLLAAWASFDDPVTALLTVYLSVLILHRSGDGSAGPLGDGTGGAWAVLGVVAASCLFAAVAYLLWRYLFRRTALAAPDGRPGALMIVATVVLAGLVAVGVARFWMLGVALIGLFFRPALVTRALPWVTGGAFLLAAFGLGVTLVRGIDPVAGLVLGAAAYASQMLIGPLVGAGLPGRERVHLALGQQNGITAIILALLLEPAFPGTIAIVAPAILVINVLYAGGNAGWNRWLAARDARVRSGRSRQPGAARRATGTGRDVLSPLAARSSAARIPPKVRPRRESA